MPQTLNILAIGRAARFSPNAEGKDNAIMQAVVSRLRRRGHHVAHTNESLMTDDIGTFDCILTMGRLPETLRRLKQVNAVVINSPEAVENCNRCLLEDAMKRLSIPMPPEENGHGYWLKRGDATTQSEDDIIYCPDKNKLDGAIGSFRARGIERFTVSAHVPGDLVKFYGVAGTGFFRICYPTESGVSKFRNELKNGLPHHYHFDISKLHDDAERLAKGIGLKIYGGDIIVESDGNYCMIDFNDWPSFSICREDAADAICSLVCCDNDAT